MKVSEKMKKRKRIKKVIWKNIVIFVFLIMVIIGAVFTILHKKDTKKVTVDYVSIIMKQQDNLGLDADFLNWVDKKYPQALKKIAKALLENNYSNNIWHDVTENSYFVLQDLYQNNYQNREDVKVVKGSKDEINIGYLGDVSLADNWDIMPN